MRTEENLRIHNSLCTVCFGSAQQTIARLTERIKTQAQTNVELLRLHNEKAAALKVLEAQVRKWDEAKDDEE